MGSDPLHRLTGVAGPQWYEERGEVFNQLVMPIKSEFEMFASVSLWIVGRGWMFQDFNNRISY